MYLAITEVVECLISTCKTIAALLLKCICASFDLGDDVGWSQSYAQ